MATEAEIKTIVTANIADFEAKMRKAVDQMNRAERQFKGSGDSIGKSFDSMKRGVQGFIAALALREVVQFGGSLVNMAGQLKDLSLQTGISAGTLSALGATLKANGSSVEDFATSVTRMNKNISEAASGDNEKVAEGLRKIGINIADIIGLTPEEQFFKIASALGKIKDQGDLTRIGIDIFGKSFSALIPVIRDTNGELEQYAQTAQDAGSALTQEQVDTLDAFGDQLDTLGIKAKNAVAGGLADLLKWYQEFDKNSRTTRLTMDAMDRAITKVNADAEAYASKAKAAGFVTSPTFGSVGVDLAAEASAGVPKPKAKAASKTVVAKEYGAVKTEIDKAKKAQKEFNDEMLEAQRFSNELGGSFRDAFADGVLGASKFGDVLSSLGQRISQIFFNKLVGDPISKFFSDAAGSILGGGGGAGGAGGGFLSSILPTFSFATGTSNVPYDTVAMLHKGEQVLTRSQVLSNQRGGGMQGTAGNTYNIDARGADAGAVARIQQSLIAMAGPGVIERRVVNAQKRGAV